MHLQCFEENPPNLYVMIKLCRDIRPNILHLCARNPAVCPLSQISYPAGYRISKPGGLSGRISGTSPGLRIRKTIKELPDPEMQQIKRF
jgi:uncharacterized protein YcsI (UPF0317 family)